MIDQIGNLFQFKVYKNLYLPSSINDRISKYFQMKNITNNILNKLVHT